MIPPELQAKISIWRAKAVDGSLSLKEMREAVAMMREGRMSAQVAAGRKRATAKAAIPDADSLMDELGGLE